MFSSASVPFQGIPDDPRYSNVAFPVPKDVSDLSNNEFLMSSFIEWIIHHTWFLHSKDMSLKPCFHVAPIWFPRRLESILRNGASTIPTDAARFNAMKLRYEFLKKGDHTIILPHFYSHHFTVVKMCMNLQKSPFFQEISCYDSLQRV